MEREFMILWAVIVAALGGIFGLAGYLGYRAGYAKAIDTQRQTLGVMWREIVEAKFAPDENEEKENNAIPKA
jgi:hypothetical protein